jgi:hypothetical protein
MKKSLRDVLFPPLGIGVEFEGVAELHAVVVVWTNNVLEPVTEDGNS